MLKKTFVRAAASIIAMAILVPPPTWAWGREGHRLTALVAENYLSPQAREAVKELLGTETMAGVASWADEYRQSHPETGAWHYTNTPSTADRYDRDRDCPVAVVQTATVGSPWRDCVVDRIAYFETRLSDKTLPRQQRAEALKFLIHLIGDLHQPFHALGDDHGGNGDKVTFLGSAQCGDYNCNLHGVWDDAMIEHRSLSEKKYVDSLMVDISQHGWEKLAGGTPVQWANVSHKYAVGAFAPNGALLDTKYYNAQIPVVDSQLALGGLRLAHVLNTILSGQAVPPVTVTPKATPEREPGPRSTTTPQ